MQRKPVLRRAVRPCCRRDDGAKVNKKDSRTLKTKTTMEENSNMTAERSLEIIRESIERSQRTITRNSAVPLIWWGVCVVVFSFIIAYLWANHGGPAWNALWAVMWLFGYVGNRMIDKKKETVPTTFVGKTIGNVWATFGMFCGGIGFLFGFIGSGILPLELIMPKVYAFGCITSVISLCFGMGTTITGLIIRNRIIQVCGFIAGLGGFFGALHFSSHEQLYVMAAVAIIGLVLPGALIQLQDQK